MKGILTDVTKCIGCERCVEACTRVNKLPPELPTGRSRGDGLTGRRFTSIVPVGKAGIEAFARKQCLHCLDPSCVSACLVGAFYKREDGPVIYEAYKCIGCRYCMLACPFSIPRYNWESPLPFIMKCKMNEECRVAGGVPACVGACPAGATIFGPRKDLLAEAWSRIKDAPDKYLPHVYGEHEFGGTSVIYITGRDAPLAKLGFPTDRQLKKRAVESLKHQSIPDLNHRWLMVAPFQFFAVFTGLFVTWAIRRRQTLAAGPHDRGGPGAPEPATAGFDEVCQTEPSSVKSDKEGE